MSFKTVDVKGLQINPITMFSDEWPLVTVGNKENGFNTMTISWGHIGHIWGKGSSDTPVLVVYIRPHRYTHAFMNDNDMFTVSILPSEYKETLAYLGKVSGRDEDKVSKAGLTPVFGYGTTYFHEAKLVFVCRKLYQSPIKEDGFADKDLVERVYPEKDFHTMYIGEIVQVLACE